MKDYIKPSVSELVGGLEGIDLKSGNNEKDLIDLALCWWGHDSGSYSILAMCLFHKMENYTEDIILNGTLYYKGTDIVEYKPEIGDGHDDRVKMWPGTASNSFEFTIHGNNAQSQNFKLGVFVFKDSLTGELKDTRHDGCKEHRGAYMWSQEGDPHGDYKTTYASSAKDAFYFLIN